MKRLLLIAALCHFSLFTAGQAQNPEALPKKPNLLNPVFASSTSSLSDLAQLLSGGVQEAWVARYNGSGSADDVAAAMAVDGSGNVYVTGSSGGDYATIKYNAIGKEQWVARYNGPGNGNDNAVALVVDGTGNVYVTGASWNGSNYDYATIKYNSAGTQEWVATYNGPGNGKDYVTALALDGAGNVYVTGLSGSDQPYNYDGEISYVYRYDYATVKYNSVGTQEWVKFYDNGLEGYFDEDEREIGSALGVDSAGNVYVAGSKNDGYATIKYNSAGTQQWVAIDDGPGDWSDLENPILVVDGLGNVYVTLSSNEYEAYGFATVKYNSSGTKVWSVHGEGNALVVDSAGNVYMTGARTVKYNSAGTQEWAVDEWGFALALDNSGNVYVTRANGAYPNYDYATIKYNSAGTQKWTASYNGPGNGIDSPAALAVDGQSNVYVAGSSVGAGTGYDYATIKYAPIPPPIADAGSDKTICAGGSVPIGGNPASSGGNGGPYTYNWSPTTGLNDPTAANPMAAPATTTQYTVTVTETATGLSATDEITVAVNEPPAGWSVAHIVDVDDVIFGIDQGAIIKPAPRDNRGLALSPDERFLYLGYSISFNQRVVRKIDLSVSDPANNHSAVIGQLQLPSGTQPARDIATDDKGRVYLALGTKIEVYNSNLQTPPLHTISGFTACEGLAVRRENNGALAVYATDRLDKTLERFVLVAGAGETITSSIKKGLDGDGEVRIIGASRPRGLDIASDGKVWIADLGKNKVYRVTAGGKTVDSTAVKSPMDIAIDESRGEVYVSQYTLRTIKVLNLSTGKIKRTLTPPAADLNIDLDGAAGVGALCGIDVGSCQRVFVTNEMGRSLLTPSGDSPFSNVGDNNDMKAADTDPVLLVTGNVLAKESEVEESEVAKSEVVTRYELAQNYPNPFNPSTKISFALPEAAEVSLKIYDIAGQLVQTLVTGVVEAGRHQVVWDGTNQQGVKVASGVYFYQLRTGDFTQVRKMSLLR